ncbi:MAG: preprotein translocase subunit SecE [Candidatus Pacebacteria bacterium]|nr:preprotein translocase subunit SecE [Candidatus Paceibacterota bacterium]MCK5413213.1 preprotein translocase subunit SecE [Candidatus Paceibacterota bacterium]
MNIFKKLKKYFVEVKSEIKKVSWPSRKVAIKDSTIVVIISLVTASFLGGMDFVLDKIIKNLF